MVMLMMMVVVVVVRTGKWKRSFSRRAGSGSAVVDRTGREDRRLIGRGRGRRLAVGAVGELTDARRRPAGGAVRRVHDGVLQSQQSVRYWTVWNAVPHSELASTLQTRALRDGKLRQDQNMIRESNPD